MTSGGTTIVIAETTTGVMSVMIARGSGTRIGREIGEGMAREEKGLGGMRRNPRNRRGIVNPPRLTVSHSFPNF